MKPTAPSHETHCSSGSPGKCVCWLFLALLAAAACSDPPEAPAPPTGPPGEMIEADAGMRPSAGGSGGVGTGGTAAVGSGGTGASGQLLNGGVGKICSTDADCPSGLTCNLDTVDWIAHRQCSTFCDTVDYCETRFGSHTMCIGANLCVSKCLDDADCPQNTFCNSNDWCENTGAGFGVPKCTGTPTPCSLLINELDCFDALGCSWSGDCSGVASSCYSQYSSYSCTSQEGCYWSSSSSSCSGSSTPCSLMSSEYTCTTQSGCSWSGDCTGTQLYSTCAEIGPTLCEFTPGCLLVSQ